MKKIKIIIVMYSFLQFGICMTQESHNSAVIPGTYKHFRTGKLYEVIGTARYTEKPSQEFVVYKQLYSSVLRPENPGDKEVPLPEGTLWVRPKDMFMEIVEHEGKRVPRFSQVVQEKKDL